MSPSRIRSITGWSGTIKLIIFPGVLKMLGKLRRELPLWQWLSNVPRITAIIIKDAPDWWGCRGLAVVLAACPASWVAARLWPSAIVHPLLAGLLLLTSSGALRCSPLVPGWSVAEAHWAAPLALLQAGSSYAGLLTLAEQPAWLSPAAVSHWLAWPDCSVQETLAQ
jgi:hypothetical protein